LHGRNIVVATWQRYRLAPDHGLITQNHFCLIHDTNPQKVFNCGRAATAIALKRSNEAGNEHSKLAGSSIRIERGVSVRRPDGGQMRVVSQATATKGSRQSGVYTLREAIPEYSNKRQRVRAAFARRLLCLSTIQS
jgi:hypothetical protein